MKEVGIIIFDTNIGVTFDNFKKILQYNLKKSVRNLEQEDKKWMKVS